MTEIFGLSHAAHCYKMIFYDPKTKGKMQIISGFQDSRKLNQFIISEEVPKNDCINL